MSIFLRFLFVIIVGIVIVAIGTFIATQSVSPDAVFVLVGVIIGTLVGELSRIFVADADRRLQLRLVALDKRLEAHQEAYRLWRKLLHNVHEPQEIGTVVMECQEWWDAHCLYLDPDARKAFNLAYSTAADHHSLVETRQSADTVRKSWADIVHAGEVIVRSIALPTIGEDKPSKDATGKQVAKN